MRKIAESMWRAMGLGVRRKKRISRFPEESAKVEKHEMVAIPTRKNDERRSIKSHKIEAKVGVAQPRECVG